MYAHIRFLILKVSLFKNWTSLYVNKVLGRKSTFLKMRNGLIFYTPNIYQTIPIIAEIFKHKVYGEIEGLRSDAIIVDVGAYVGTFSLYAVQKYPDATIYAFEPESSNFAALVKNALPYKNIIPIKKAVGVQSGTATLYVRGEGYGTNSINSTQGTPIRVSITSLRDFFSEKKIERCDLLKLDCEGNELAILASLPKEVERAITELARNEKPLELPIPVWYAPKAKTSW